MDVVHPPAKRASKSEDSEINGPGPATISEFSKLRGNPRNLSGPDTTAVSSLLLRAQNGREFYVSTFRRPKNDRIAFGTRKVHYY